MKDSYADWVALKKDAMLEKAQDICKDKGTAEVSIGVGKATVVHRYKLQGSSWVKQK